MHHLWHEDSRYILVISSNGNLHNERKWEKEVVDLLSLISAGKFFCPVVVPFLCWYENLRFLDSNGDWEPQLFRNMLGLQRQIVTAEM